MEPRHLHLRGALGQTRTEMFNGREHLVVPVVALMDGVIHAINASTPERVTTATLAKAATSWNGRPLMFGHPTRNGQQISANDAKVIETHGFGTIFNSRMAGPKLLMDAFIDPIKAEQVGGAQFVNDLRSGKDCSVSVGAFVVTDPTPGVHPSGKPYKATWMDTSGDHLAFLPNGVGACSLEMGCGANRSAALRAAGTFLPPVMHMVTAEGFETLRDISQAERDKMSASDFGDPDNQLYPIKTQEDVDAASHLIGKAGPEVKTRIIAIAKRKGLSIPDAWRSAEGLRTLEECPKCDGTGMLPNGNECPMCDGTGDVDDNEEDDDLEDLEGRAAAALADTSQVVNTSRGAMFKVGDKVKINKPGAAAHGDIGVVDQSYRGGMVHRVKSPHPTGEVLGTFHQSNLRAAEEKPAKKTLRERVRALMSHLNTDQVVDAALSEMSAEQLAEFEALAEKPQCPLCKGTGKIRGGKVTCPDCKGSGFKALGGPGSGPHVGIAAKKAGDDKGSFKAGKKDRLRIKDILRKSQDPDKQLALAKQMANSIDKPDKAARRADAADQHAPHLAQPFHDRVDELSARAAEGLITLDASEDAELIGYQALKTLFEQFGSSYTSATSIVDELIAAEIDNPTVTDDEEAAEEEVETARLESVQVLCMAMFSSLNAVLTLVRSLNADGPSPAYPATTGFIGMEGEVRSAVGARHNAADQATIQSVHDHSVDLGADCPGIKAAAACGCQEESMTKEERAATIKALTENKETGLVAADSKWLEQVPDERLETMKTLAEAKLLALAKSPADMIIQNKANADAAVAAHGHALNMTDQAAAARKAAKDKAAADGTGNDDEEDDEEDDDDPKQKNAEGRLKAARAELKAAKAAKADLVAPRAKLKAAKAAFAAFEASQEGKMRLAEKAGLSLQEYEEQEYLKTAPDSIRTLVADKNAADAARKTELIEVLAASQDEYTKKELGEMKLRDLERMSRVAQIAVPVADFSGRGMPRAAAGADDPYLNSPDPYAAGLKALREGKTIQ